MRADKAVAEQGALAAVPADYTTKEGGASEGYVHYADHKTKEELIYEDYVHYCIIRIGVRPASFDTWMALQDSLWSKPR